MITSVPPIIKNTAKQRRETQSSRDMESELRNFKVENLNADLATQ